MSRELNERSARFAHAVYKAWRGRFRSPETRFVATQVVRSSSSAAANYRASGLGRSPAEFVAKLGLAREESDETVFWLDFAQAVNLAEGPAAQDLRREAGELSAIFSAAYRTAKENAK